MPVIWFVYIDTKNHLLANFVCLNLWNDVYRFPNDFVQLTAGCFRLNTITSFYNFGIVSQNIWCVLFKRWKYVLVRWQLWDIRIKWHILLRFIFIILNEFFDSIERHFYCKCFFRTSNKILIYTGLITLTPLILLYITTTNNHLVFLLKARATSM